MTRPCVIWTVFAIFIVLLLAPMAWLSVTAVKLEAAQEESRRRDRMEEAVRLGLWRLDSALGDLVAEETRRPYQSYEAFFAAEEAFDANTNGAITGGVLVPSHLLGKLPQHVLLHFQIDASGNIGSPQVPTGELRELALQRYTTPKDVATASQRLVDLKKLLDLTRLRALLPGPVRLAQGLLQFKMQTYQEPQVEDSIDRSRREWQARNYRFENRQNVQQLAAQSRNMAPREKLVVHEGASKALWMGDALVVARRVTSGKTEQVQGTWIDWKSLRPALLESIKDILEDAQLEPVREGDKDQPTRTLTSLPVRLVPGAAVAGPAVETSPIRFSLVLAWGCALLAALAVGILLTGTLALSERRRDFVSAVTHELRTPLTTFRMYTEMLVEGMLPDREKQDEYLRKLKGESDRLAHLVENVLSYARLEARSRADRLEAMRVGDLLERVLPRLQERAEQGRLELVNSAEKNTVGRLVSVDPAAVDQILFNLVDNAAKYAATSEDRRLHVETQTAGDAVHIKIRDHGPGIPKGEQRRLFRPFMKSRKSVAPAAPGVGLGLALSLRLARSLGGDLTIDGDDRGGASFTLSVPLA